VVERTQYYKHFSLVATLLWDGSWASDLL
jgi:hypothetical protein